MQIQITLKGRLDKNWEEWFDNLSITSDGQNTILNGTVADESAFHGILNLIRDLNLKLISAQIINEL